MTKFQELPPEEQAIIERERANQRDRPKVEQGPMPQRPKWLQEGSE